MCVPSHDRDGIQGTQGCVTLESVAFSTYHPPVMGKRGGRETQIEGLGSQPASRAHPSPVPKASPESHKGGSVPAVPTAHIRAVCPPPPFLLGLAATLGHSAPGRGQ